MKQPVRVYFSDDIVETYLVCSEGENAPARPSVSTVDFLTWADQSAGIVLPHQVADAIGHMIRLRVMSVTVEQRYLVAAIPDALNEATSRAQAETILRNAPTFQSILDGVWDHFKPFTDLLTHFAVTMSYLLNEGRASEEVLVSLWLHWLRTIRFQTKPNKPPLQKMLMAFINILELLNSENDVVRRLWGSFWTALGRGLGNELNKAEDQVAIEEVARFLGAGRALEEREATAMALFEKAKMGLEPGTEHVAWLNEEYVHAMVRQEITNQASS